MALKMKREVLERIVYEELHRYIAEQMSMVEAPPSRGTVLDGQPTEDEVPAPEDAPEEQLPTDSPAVEVGDESDELPAGDEPADDDLEADLAGEEPDEEDGTVGGEIAGKTIDSITLEEDSKILPGATEVVVTFRENPDALRLLVTKTGKMKIFYKGLHNDFSSPIEQIPGADEPDPEMGGEEEPGEEFDVPTDEPLEDMPPLGDEDMPPEMDDEDPLPGT
jgi:hypothetical protein